MVMFGVSGAGGLCKGCRQQGQSSHARSGLDIFIPSLVDGNQRLCLLAKLLYVAVMD